MTARTLLKSLKDFVFMITVTKVLATRDILLQCKVKWQKTKYKICLKIIFLFSVQPALVHVLNSVHFVKNLTNFRFDKIKN